MEKKEKKEKKVNFSDPLVTERYMIPYFCDARDGSNWITESIDRARFQRRIADMENVLKPILINRLKKK